MRRKDPASLQKLQQKFEEGGDRRPPLHQWMLSNYDEVAALFAGARLNWQHLTASFSEMGFKNGTGGELQPEAVRQTWYRVRKQKARMMPPHAAASVEVLSQPPQTTPSPVTPSSSAADPLADLRAEMNKRSGRN